MDLRKLKTLIDLVSESNVSELEITEAEGKVRIVKAGAAPEDAEKVAAAVEAGLPVDTSVPVKYQDIRAKVLEVLGAVNPTVAAAFAVYQKPA